MNDSFARVVDLCTASATRAATSRRDGCVGVEPLRGAPRRDARGARRDEDEDDARVERVDGEVELASRRRTTTNDDQDEEDGESDDDAGVDVDVGVERYPGKGTGKPEIR